LSRASWVGVLCVVAVSALLVSVGAEKAQAGLTSVWAVDDGEKIFRDNITSPLKTGNSVWDGSSVSLFAARNEIVAFQLMLQADGSGANTVNVTVSDLTNGGYTIKGSHPLPSPNNYVGVGVELFTEHYLNVSTLSGATNGAYLNWSAAARPSASGMTPGWMPDALVPFSAASGEGGAPFDISANRNQGVWADIYVKKSLPAGIYTGTITVTVGGSPVATVPLTLEVLNFTLPDENHYQSMVFYSGDGIRPRYGLTTSTQWPMLLEFNKMAHRHRLDLIGEGSGGEIDNMPGVLSGSAYTAAQNYEGPGEGVGNGVFSIGTYGAWWGASQSYYETASDAWENWFAANAPNVERFLYLVDEPGSGDYANIMTRANWIHNNPGPGRNLPVFITKNVVSSLIGYVDIWCSATSGYNETTASQAKGRGEGYWAYAAYRPKSAADVIDDWGIAFRIKPWIAYKCNVDRWFTWESTHWIRNSNETNPSTSIDVWTNPLTFDYPSQDTDGMGDGTLFYPGRDYVFPAQDRQFDGPISSIRLKMYRRGAQDYEYMWLAAQRGQGTQVQSILQGVLPHVMSSALTVPDWSNANITYEYARSQLADLILGAGPEADFTGNPTGGGVPLTVAFTDTSGYSPTSWSWNFGDGGTSTLQHPSHEYTAAGSYTVSLTATNADGSDTETKSNYITLTTTPPVAAFAGVPTSGYAPLTVSFTDLSANYPTSWAWGFGDGGTSSSKNPSHEYTAAGSYTVSLTATSPYGSDAETKANYITVNPTVYPPVADFSGTPTSGAAPLTVAFTDASTNTPTAWSWSFGDGGTSTVQNPSHVFNCAGSYAVSLTVTNVGGSDVETKTNYIAASAPPGVVYLSDLTWVGTPTNGWGPVEKDMSVGENSAGDGVTICLNGSYYTKGLGCHAVSTITYNLNGLYDRFMSDVGLDDEMPVAGSVVFRVEADGVTLYTSGTMRPDTATASFDVSVADKAQLVLYLTDAGDGVSSDHGDWAGARLTLAPPGPPVANFSGAPTSGVAPLTVAFTDSSTKAPTSWSWAFGDGGTSISQNPSHQYTAAGSYTVSLTATNALGSNTNTKSNYITVKAAGSMPWFVAAGAVASGTGAITPALPAGIATNDILLLFLETANQALTISNQNGGTWAAVANSPQGTGTAAASTATRLTVFWSRYNGTQGAPTTNDSGDHQLGRMIAMRGVATSGNPWDVTAGAVEATADTSGAIPGATTTVANTLVVAAISTSLPDAEGTANFSAWANSDLISVTEETDNTTSAGNGGGLGLAVAIGGKPTPGAYGTTTVTCATAATKGMMSIALKPTAVPVPVANFSGTPTSGNAPLGVSFTDTSTNSPTSWSWTFGDGGVSTAQNPSHTYQNAGGVTLLRTVSLTATNAGGSNTNTKNNYITVNPPAPVAAFSATPTTGTAPLAVSFTDTSTSSPTSWLWEFGDGATSSEQNPSHTYQNAGGVTLLRTVTLTATNDGGSDTETKTDYIAVVPPATAAGFSAAPTTGTAPLAVSFTDTSTSSPTSWLWEFGDGATSSEQNPTHTYENAGGVTLLRTVSLTAANAGGSDTKTKTDYITVVPPAPVAAFSAAPTSGTAPLGVSFGDLSTNSPTSWSWDFGDGGSSTAQNPSHTYENTGGVTLLRTVSLTAGNDGGSDTETKTDYIAVVPAAPVAEFSATPTAGTAPLGVSFSDLSTNSPTSWLWDFGDGGASTEQHPSHQYTTAGTYTVSLTVGNDGGSDAVTKADYVTVAMVAGFTAAPPTGMAPLTVSFADTSAGNPTSWSWAFGDGASASAQNPSHQYAHGGQYTVSLTATNLGGSDTMTKSNYIAATYHFLGFLPPVAEHKPFKQGSTIPLKFRIADGAGSRVPDAVATLVIGYLGSGAPAGQPIVASMAAGDASEEFRYSASDDLYIYNLSTKDASYLNYYTYSATIQLDDGQTYSVDFALK